MNKAVKLLIISILLMSFFISPTNILASNEINLKKGLITHVNLST